ncbi:MAG: hypothetical protein M0R17_01675 [Candidatus Omnitrophica bacterium]|nr:hypothetical protein [Candidatus Omnitrophota bacterium]
MSRIVPQNNQHSQKLPNWMQTDELIKASQSGQPIQKTASQTSTVAIKYACEGCAKVFLADNPELKNQQRLAVLKNTEAELKCPDCNGVLKVSESTIASSENKESRSTDSYQIEKEANYSTFTDRLIVMKALDALQQFASKVGLFHADVKYQRSEHTRQAGQQNDMLNAIDCQIDWQYGRNQHARVYASVVIDPAGKIIMPRVFKTAQNIEYPFDKETVANLMSDTDFKGQVERQPRKTDTPTFRKPDPTNFHMASEKQSSEYTFIGQFQENGKTVYEYRSKDGNTCKTDKPLSKEEEEMGFENQKQADQSFPEPSTETNTELLANVRSLYGDPTNTTGLTMPEVNNLTEAQVNMLQHIIDQHNSIVDGGSQSVNDLIQQANDILYSSRVAWDNPASISTQPTQPQPVQPAGVINQQLNPQQAVYNPQDNKQYTVKQQTPQATTLVDTQTNQESMVPAGQEQNLKPVVKTTAEIKAFEDEALKEHIYRDLDESVKKTKMDVDSIDEDHALLEQINSKKARVGKMARRWNDIRKSFKKDMQAGSWKGSITGGLEHFSNIPQVISVEYNTGQVFEDPEEIKYALLKGHEDLTIKFDDGTVKAACQAGGTVMMVGQDPIVIRASLAYDNEYNGDVSRMPRQVRALKELGFSPEKDNKDETGHSDHGIPMEEDKKIEIGLTDFPIGKTKGKGDGYNIPFKKMDENQVKDRENFPDRDMLPYGKQPARDIEYNGPKTNSPLDEVESSLREAVGFDIKINRPEDEEQVPSVTKKSPNEVTVKAPESKSEEKKPLVIPVQPKLNQKKAPGLEEYKEPGVIPKAGGKVSEAITKLHQVIQQKEEVETKMEAALKPIKETLDSIKKPYESELAKQADVMSSYINMVYDQLTQSGDHVQAYEKMIWAVVSREKAVSPSATLPQVLAEADKLDKELSEQIRKLKAIIENKNMQLVIERFLYEFPISGTQQKKIQSADKGEENGEGNTIISLLKQFEEWIREMIPINTSVLETLLAMEL